MGDIDYIYNPADAAWYAAFAPIFWCLCFAWIIFTSHLQYKSNYRYIYLFIRINRCFSAILSNFLSWRIFLITTRIAYTVYLTQFPVFFFNIGTIRTVEYFGVLRVMVCIIQMLKYNPFNLRKGQRRGWHVVRTKDVSSRTPQPNSTRSIKAVYAYYAASLFTS